jgi:hypothetical protein
VLGSIEPPKVKHVVKDSKAGITYEVMAYRKLSGSEVHFAIAQYLSQRKSRPRKGNTITIVTIFGITPRL